MANGRVRLLLNKGKKVRLIGNDQFRQERAEKEKNLNGYLGTKRLCSKQGQDIYKEESKLEARKGVRCKNGKETYRVLYD